MRRDDPLRLQLSGTTPRGLIADRLYNWVLVVRPALEICEWGEGSSWEQAFQTAFDEVVDDAASYHVCNNDAVLQAGLRERFQTGEPLPTCGDRETLCRGPRWFYVPHPS